MLRSLFGKNKREEKDKKGALTTRQIVLLIILIASFVVILYFFMSAELGEESEKQICHDSVIRASNSKIPGTNELNCERTYICITKDGTCEGMSKPQKEKVENLDEVYNILAEEMAECWWMFGGGELNYIGDKLTKKNYCSTCSQILFDDSLNDLEGVKDGRIDQDELYNYMKNHNISVSGGQQQESETYTEYILGTNNLTNLKQQITSHKNYSSTNEPSFGQIIIGKEYYVVMGIVSDVSIWKWIGAGVGGAGTVQVLSKFISFIPGGKVVGAVIIGAGAAAGGVAEMIEPEIGAITVEGEQGASGNKFMAPTIVEAKSEKFEVLNCKEQLVYP